MIASTTARKGGLDTDLIRVLAHPARVHALYILNHKVASPKELAPEVGETIGNMAYHVRVLAKGGFIELVETQQRRGATEHRYRAARPAIFEEDEWAQVPPSIKTEIVAMQLRATGKLLTESLGSEAFERRPDRHHSLIESLVDEQGWTEVMDVVRGAMERVLEIQAESKERRLSGEGDEVEEIPLAVSMIAFERAAEQFAS